jgi:hypothetical protein
MRYSVFNTETDVELSSYDKITFCINDIYNYLDNSKLSWNEYFKSNPFYIYDNRIDKIIWSTKNN